SARLIGLSQDFMGPLDPTQPSAATDAAKTVLLASANALAPTHPAASAALAGLAEGLTANAAPKVRTKAEAATFKPWIDDTTAQWRQLENNSFQRPPPPRTIEYNLLDLDFVTHEAEAIMAAKPKTAPVDKLSQAALAQFTVDWCKLESFDSELDRDPSTDKPWLQEPTPWRDPAELLRKLALDEAAVDAIIHTGESDIQKRIRTWRMEAVKAKTPADTLSEPAKLLNYLFNITRIARQLERCEHNLGLLTAYATTPAIPATLLAIQTKLQSLKDTATAFAVFEAVLAPLAVRATVAEITASNHAGNIAFGTYTLHPGRISISANAGDGVKTNEPVAQLELRVQDVGPVSVAVGPLLTVCSNCIHSVSERAAVVDQDGTATVHRTLTDEKSGMSIGYAAMLHYSLWGGTRHQFGPALGYPLRDQTGTALSVLGGFGYRNTLGVQVTLGVHVFETRKPVTGRTFPIDLSSPATATLTAADVTTPTVTAAFFIFVGATSDLLMKP
ncbi:MAG: hypothetical protein RL701_4382, partial [Pseudomonadota bacterium]